MSTRKKLETVENSALGIKCLGKRTSLPTLIILAFAVSIVITGNVGKINIPLEPGVKRGEIHKVFHTCPAPSR
jgi:hypothetical protein